MKEWMRLYCGSKREQRGEKKKGIRGLVRGFREEREGRGEKEATEMKKDE